MNTCEKPVTLDELFCLACKVGVGGSKEVRKILSKRAKLDISDTPRLMPEKEYLWAESCHDLTVGEITALGNMAGGPKVIRDILEGRAWVSIIETPRWFRSEAGFIGLRDIPYEHRSPREWVERFEKGGIRVGEDVLEALSLKLPAYSSIPGARNQARKFKIVILQGKEGETIGDVWKRGVRSGLTSMTSVAACHLRSFISKSDLKEMELEGLVCMEDAKDRITTGTHGYQLLLGINRDPVNPHFMLTDGNDRTRVLSNRGYAFLD